MGRSQGCQVGPPTRCDAPGQVREAFASQELMAKSGQRQGGMDPACCLIYNPPISMAATHKALMETIRGIHISSPSPGLCIDHRQLRWGSSGAPRSVGPFAGEGRPTLACRPVSCCSNPSRWSCLRAVPRPPVSAVGGRSTKPSRECRSIACSCVRFTHRFAEQAASTFIEQLLVEKLGVHYLVVGDDFASARGGRGLPPAGGGRSALRVRGDQHPEFPAFPPAGQQHPGA